MKLIKYKKEIIINFNKDEQFASIYTYNASMKLRLTKFAVQYQNLCRLERMNTNRDMTFAMYKSCLSFHVMEPYSKEYKRKASE